MNLILTLLATFTLSTYAMLPDDHSTNRKQIVNKRNYLDYSRTEKSSFNEMNRDYELLEKEREEKKTISLVVNTINNLLDPNISFEEKNFTLALVEEKDGNTQVLKEENTINIKDDFNSREVRSLLCIDTFSHIVTFVEDYKDVLNFICASKYYYESRKINLIGAQVLLKRDFPTYNQVASIENFINSHRSLKKTTGVVKNYLKDLSQNQISLYRIDLSMILKKYLPESQGGKVLNEMFSLTGQQPIKLNLSEMCTDLFLL